jgi:hypothetical protein
MFRAIKNSNDQASSLSSSSSSSAYSISTTSTFATSTNNNLKRGFETTSSFFVDHERNTIIDPVNNPRLNTLKTERGPTAATSWRPECFSIWPQIATDDTLQDDALKKLNKGQSWFQYCQQLIKQANKDHDKKNKESNDSDDEYDYDPPPASETNNNSTKQDSFHFGFPIVLNFPEKLHHCTLHFSLPSEQMKLSDLYAQLINTGYISLKLNDKAVLELADHENLIGEKHNASVRYHWKVLHIMITQEHNRLPVELDVQLTTVLPDTASTTRVEWISKSGIGAEGIEHYVTVPGVKRISKADQHPLYIADDSLNSCEATRWLEVDEKAFEVSLQSMKQGTNYVIPMPEEKHYVANDPVQFLVVSEFRRIVELCQYYKIQDLPQVKKDGSRYVDVVPQSVLNLIANEKWAKYDKKKMLMRVEDFELTLKPIGQKWREDFESYINKYKVMSNSDNAVPQFVMKIEIAYFNYEANKQFRGAKPSLSVQNDLILSPNSNNNNGNSYKVSSLYGSR